MGFEKRDRYNHNYQPSKGRMTPEQKRQLVLDTVSGATAEEPLTLKGITNHSNLSMDDVKFFCDRLSAEKQINVKMIPDPTYPVQKVRAFYKKF